MCAALDMRLHRVHLARVDSTNTHARALALELLARGESGLLAVVTADEQRAGRGRLGRSWSSGRGDLKLSFAFEVPGAALATAYQLSPLLSVAVVRGTAAARYAGGGALPPLGIKWPNDLVVGGARKVGGILCELEALPNGGHVAVLGVGINVHSDAEALGVPRPVWPLTTLRAEAAAAGSARGVGSGVGSGSGGGGGSRDRGDGGGGGGGSGGGAGGSCSSGSSGVGGAGAAAPPPLDLGVLTDAIVAAFARALPEYWARGFAPFQAEYEAASVLLGRRVRFTTGGGGGGSAVSGVAVSIHGDGRLRIAPDDGGAHRDFLCGEVSGVELMPGAFVEGEPDGH